MPAIQGFQVPDLLREVDPPWGDRVVVEVEDLQGESSDGLSADFVVRLSWEGQTYRFVAEAKTRSTPKVVQTAAEQAREYARSAGLLPMVVVPYLSDRQAQALIERGVSGLDLSGNGVIAVPGEMLLCRTGRRNQYPESQPVRYAYRGSTSVVPRVFLTRPSYGSVKELRSEIQSRGVKVAASTVSKALSRMEEDVLIRRDQSGIELLQPDELLDRLAKSYQPSRTTRGVDLRTNLSPQEVFERCPETLRCTLTGAASMPEYAVGARGDVTEVYCESMSKLKQALGDAWDETGRFADLRVTETRDKELFFDTRRRSDGVVVASPVQTYLGLNAGDKRDKQIAEQVRTQILSTVEQQRGQR